jgi:hypothetical protein
LPRCKKPENGVKPTRPKPLKQPLLLAALRRDSLALMCRKLTRPIYHHKEGRSDGHLFITVLAYQCVQFLRVKLKAAGITDSWATLRDILSVQRRVTATFSRRDGHSLHVRKATVAEPDLLAIYRALGISATPGGTRKLIS